MKLQDAKKTVRRISFYFYGTKWRDKDGIKNYSIEKGLCKVLKIILVTLRIMLFAGRNVKVCI